MELTLALTLVGFVVSLLMQFLVTSSRVAVNVRSSAGIQVDAQYGLDLLSQDIEGSDLCLASYTNAGTTYTSSVTTLVLRTPAQNSAGTALVSGSMDYVIYKYDATTKKLKRTIVPGSGSGRTAVANQILVENVTSVAFTYIAAQTQAQNALGSLRIFVLLNGAVYGTPVGSAAVQQAIVAGVDQCAGSSSCYAGTSLTLSSAITASAPMDLRFSVDPSVTVSASILSGCGVTCPAGETANFAKQVAVVLKVTAPTGSGNSQAAAPPAATFTTTAALRNKAAF